MFCATLTVFDISMATTQLGSAERSERVWPLSTKTLSATVSDHELGRGHRRQRDAAATFAVVRGRQRFLRP